MYRAIVAALTRKTWRQIGAGNLEAAFGLAHPDMHFRFVGTTALSAELTGRDAFKAWFERAATILPGLRFTVQDVAVAGWPWHTRVSTRLAVSATLADGTEYRNEASQWITLRWGRMVDDWVLEDTETLSAAVETNATHSAAVGAPV